jgi:hypothetical protein
LKASPKRRDRGSQSAPHLPAQTEIMGGYNSNLKNGNAGQLAEGFKNYYF